MTFKARLINGASLFFSRRLFIWGSASFFTRVKYSESKWIFKLEKCTQKNKNFNLFLKTPLGIVAKNPYAKYQCNSLGRSTINGGAKLLNATMQCTRVKYSESKWIFKMGKMHSKK
jgi:hypothetical protein